MEKILLVLDPNHVNMAAVEFACYLARLTNSRLTGLFPEDLVAQPALASHIEEPHTAPPEENFRLFKSNCRGHGIPASIHHDHLISLEEAVEESRFADLLLIDPETAFYGHEQTRPHRLVKDILADAECPVMITPESFHTIDELFFAFQTSPSAVSAIKIFTYLFPSWRNKKLTIIDMQHPPGPPLAAGLGKLLERLEQHYDHVEMAAPHANPADQLFGLLLNRKNALLITDTFDSITHPANVPVFIANDRRHPA